MLSPVVIAVVVFVAVTVIAAATILNVHRGGLQLGQVHVTDGLEVVSGLPSNNNETHARRGTAKSHK